MKFLTREIFCLHLIMWNVTGKYMTTCDSTISMYCDDSRHKMAVRQTNSSPLLVQDFLENCNAHRECHVKNKNKECVQVKYWCRTDLPVLEIKGLSTHELTTNFSMLGLMSDGYDNGKYQDAANITCNLQTGKDGDATKMQINIHELAPFAHSRDFCLSVNNSTEPVFCSGSGKLYTFHGPVDCPDGLQFQLTLSGSVQVKVRFWIDIFVSSETALTNKLECTSVSAIVQASWITILVATATGMSLLAFGIIIAIYYIKFRQGKPVSSAPAPVQTNEYYEDVASNYVDTDHPTSEKCHGNPSS